MLNKKGMVLLEALLLLLICMILINIILLCVKARYTIEKVDEGGFQDEEVQAIYQQH